jgi:hypothetical protein
VETKKSIYALTYEEGEPMTKKQRVSTCCSGLFAAVVFLASPLYGLPKNEGVACDCYYACIPGNMCECADPNQKCNLISPGCDLDGKRDGKCVIPPIMVPSFDTPDTPSLLTALNLYFEAYLVPVSEGEGRPDAEVLDAALAVQLGAGNEKLHSMIQDGVHEALDALIGFDLVLPMSPGKFNDPGQGVGPPRFGNIRGTPALGVEIINAARTGIMEAIQYRNLNEIDEHLADFWQEHPDFHPNHAGRYYPHGHADYGERVGTPLVGQSGVIKLFVGSLLADGSPVCGDDNAEGTEECDGSDDMACGGLGCSSACTCGTIVVE